VGEVQTAMPQSECENRSGEAVSSYRPSRSNNLLLVRKSILCVVEDGRRSHTGPGDKVPQFVEVSEGPRIGRFLVSARKETSPQILTENRSRVSFRVQACWRDPPQSNEHRHDDICR